jgi:hypothetical protein
MHSNPDRTSVPYNVNCIKPAKTVTIYFIILHMQKNKTIFPATSLGECSQYAHLKVTSTEQVQKH